MTPRRKGIIAAVTFLVAVISAVFVAGYTITGAVQALIHGEILYGLYMLMLSLPLGALVGTFWTTAAFVVKR